MKLFRELWTKPFGEYEDKNIRLLALITSFIFHFAFFIILWLLVQNRVPPFGGQTAQLPELGGMAGGGGGGESKNIEVEFGPSPGDDDATVQDQFHPEKVHLIHLRIRPLASEGIPVIVADKKQKTKVSKKVPGSSLAKDFPKRRVRGLGPGSGGGTGGGSGGGIGKGHGYSIDWGGTGTRRLISGRIPQYPKGTDKEMAVTLEFTVFPDGSVAKVVPLMRGDELLEHAAIEALQSWRFDPLPPQIDQKLQYGKITFNFKLEQAAVRQP